MTAQLAQSLPEQIEALQALLLKQQGNGKGMGSVLAL
jgi:hypothetical protein